MANHRLWAPWRLSYIQAAREEADTGGSDCIFCSKPALGDDVESLIPYRGERCYVMLNAFPYTNGHVMVAPFEHTGDLHELDPDTSAELMSLVQRSVSALERAYGPDGFNLGANLGRIAGAGFPGHLHFHVVPRWAGDTNFMPVVGDTRVMPQSLEESYAALRDAFSEVT